MAFSARIKHIRESKGISEDQLAQSSGIDLERLGHLEEDTEPTVSEAAQLAEAFGMRIEELFAKEPQTDEQEAQASTQAQPTGENGSSNLFAGVESEYRRKPDQVKKQSDPQQSKEHASPGESHLHQSLDRLIRKVVVDQERQKAYLAQTSKLMTPTSLSEALHFHEVALGVVVDLCDVIYQRIGSADDEKSRRADGDTTPQALADRVRGDHGTSSRDVEQMQRSLKIIARCLGDDFPQLSDADKEQLRVLQK